MKNVIIEERERRMMSFRRSEATEKSKDPSLHTVNGFLPSVEMGVMAKNVCCFFIFLDKRTSQKMLYVLEKKALDDHDNGFS